MTFELYAIKPAGFTDHVESFTEEEAALEAFELLKDSGKVRAIFLDKKVPNENPISIKTWRKRKHDNQARGQSSTVRKTA